MDFVFLVDLRPVVDRADFRGLGSASIGMLLFLGVVMAIVAIPLRRFAGGMAVYVGWRSPISSRSANPS